MTRAEELVWAEVLKDRQASPEQIAERSGVGVGFVKKQLDRISSPNWREDPWPHASGEGRKDDHDKPRMDLVPPEAFFALAAVLTFGARKYNERNWEQGMAWGRPYAALMRHMLAWWEGEDRDPETGYSHLWHALCCVVFLVAFEERCIGTDDRPTRKGPSDARVAEEEGSDTQVA